MSARKIRVLVVDDSVVYRRLIKDALAIDPDIEVVGSAANGSIALQKIPQVNPDLVTLDVEMPVMDGLDAVREIRKTYPDLPVVMVSTLTERGGGATLEALARGASDYVTKPGHSAGPDEAMARMQSELLPKVRAFCAERAGHKADGRPTRGQRRVPPPTRGSGRARPEPAPIEVLTVGVSTGGPNALGAFIPALPRLPVPILIVQHMPPVFTRLLAERLSASAAFPVREAQGGEKLEPGVAYIAPGGFHMVVEGLPSQARLRLNEDPPENSCRPAVDPLFRSVASTWGPRALALVLTGMGKDGLRGCEHIVDAGGAVFVQDEATSVVWGMPGFVARANLAEKVLPLADIAPEVARRIQRSRNGVLSAEAGHRGEV